LSNNTKNLRNSRKYREMTNEDFSSFEDWQPEVTEETNRLILLHNYETFNSFKMFESLAGLEFRILGNNVYLEINFYLKKYFSIWPQMVFN